MSDLLSDLIDECNCADGTAGCVCCRAHAALIAAKAENARLRTGLDFYARGQHMYIDELQWDTVSGEPPNWMCDDAGTATIEIGGIAKNILAGMTMRTDAEGNVTWEPAQPAKADAT